MAGSTVSRMKNFQIFLFCSADAISLIINGGIIIFLVLNKKARVLPSNIFFTSILAFHLITALCAINFAVLFTENKAKELRKDTVIVQITFTLIGIGLNHIMLAIDRIMSTMMRENSVLVMGNRQVWFMIAVSWFIPTFTAVTSASVASNGDPGSKVSYALATLTMASGLTAIFALLGFNSFLLKQMQISQNQPYVSTRRLRRSIVAERRQNALPSRVSMMMSVSYVILMFPQILFAIGKLSKTRGLLDMWYMQLSSTIMLCCGIVDATLYIYLNKELRNGICNIFARSSTKKNSMEKDIVLIEKPAKNIDEIDNMDPSAIDTLLLKSTYKKDIDIAVL